MFCAHIYAKIYFYKSGYLHGKLWGAVQEIINILCVNMYLFRLNVWFNFKCIGMTSHILIPIHWFNTLFQVYIGFLNSEVGFSSHMT